MVNATATDLGGVGSTTATNGRIGWPLPPNTDFFHAYVITITSTHRNTTVTVSIIATTESQIPLVPFSANTVTVHIYYMPPGSTETITALLVAPVVIQSLEGGKHT